ncbi:MAG: hypothetical protein F6K35_34265 [Okeania sp. SIO2H7]|nr:hypothetical protein [Okeania sp. SIO2H7]
MVTDVTDGLATDVVTDVTDGWVKCDRCLAANRKSRYCHCEGGWILVKLLVLSLSPPRGNLIKLVRLLRLI